MHKGLIRTRLSKTLMLVLLAGLAQINGLSAQSPDPGFLSENQSPAGAIAREADLSTPEQSTAQAVLTFQALSLSDSPVADRARQYLPAPDATTTTEVLALWLTTRPPDQPFNNALAELFKRQNSDGGFGTWAGYASDPLSTGLALAALADRGLLRSEQTSGAIAYLATTQKANGSWSIPAGNLNNVEVTAIAAKGLWRYRKIYAVLDQVDAALDYLRSQRGSPLWSSVEASALALDTLLNRSVDRTGYESVIETFEALQQPNGSFEGDTYLTALGLRVINTARTLAPDATFIGGRLVDGEFGQPLADAQVSLQGVDSFNSISASDGGFSFEAIPPGAYELALIKPGFSRITTQVNLQTGDKIDLGTLQLSALQTDPETGEPVVTATVRGSVTEQLTGDPISGARVAIAGQDLATTTDAQGGYLLAGIEPGEVSLSISAEGFQTANANPVLEERQTLVFSPALPKLPSTDVTLEGMVSAGSTGEPLAGVLVEISTDEGEFSITTASDGSYRLADLPPGSMILTASLDQYRPVTASTEAAPGANLDFSPQMHRQDEQDQPDLGGLKALLVNEVTGRGIEGVSVNVTYRDLEQTREVLSGPDGDWVLTELPLGDLRVRLEHPGFVPIETELTLQPGLITDLGQVPLTPVDAQPGGSLVGRILNVRTGEPLPGAVIDVQSSDGTTSREQMSGPDGLFDFQLLPAGDYRLSITKEDFTSTDLAFSLEPGDELDLGAIKLRPPGIDALLPDIAVSSLDSSGLAFDQETFELSGSLAGVIVNRGNARVTTAFEITAFEDTNRNGERDEGDQVVGSTRLDPALEGALPVDGETGFSLDVTGTLSFFQAPLLIKIDSGERLAELSRANNHASTARACAGQGGPSVDLALCMDSSGSVSNSDFQLQLEGAALAVEDPDVIPRDGSARLSVVQFASSSTVEIEPVIIEEDNAQDVADAIRAIGRHSGGTSIHSCINTATDLLTDASPASSFQVIDVSTDGRSSFGSAVNASENARLQGIDSINAIGVGSGIDTNLLEAMVFPQPAGGERGFVVTVEGFEEYVEALAGKIQKETRTVDLTLGRLELLDGGFGAPASARLVVGNAGAGAITQAVSVKLYDADPGEGGRLLAEQRLEGGLSTAESRELLLEDLDPASLAGGQLVAVAEIDGGFSECSLANNRQSIDVQSTLGEVTLALSDSELGPQSELTMSSVVTNPGALSGDYDLLLEIQDAGGESVAVVDTKGLTELAPNSSETFENLWNTGLTPAGDYRARAALFDPEGRLLDEATEAFAIAEPDLGGAAVQLRAATDRPSYHIDDRVRLEMLAENRSQILALSDPQLSARVSGPGGVVIFEEQLEPASMAPGQVLTFERIAELRQSPTGVYTFTLSLTAANTQASWQDTAEFEVVNDLNAALAGNLGAEKSRLFQGDAQSCHYRIENTGLVDVQAAPFEQLVIRLDEQAVASRSELSLDLAAGDFARNTDTFSTAELVPGDYACVLQSTLEGEDRVLASAQFQVLPPPVEFDIGLHAPMDPHLLVWTDGLAGPEPGGEPGHPDLEQQLETLVETFEALGVRHTIESSAEGFANRFYSGRFNQFLLLAENEAPDAALQRALSQSVLTGSGALLAAGALEDTRLLHSVAGVRLAGTRPQAGRLLLESADFAGLAGPLDLGDSQAIRSFHLQGASILAGFDTGPSAWQFEDGLSCRVGDTAPALVGHNWGAGASLTAGFDLALEASQNADWRSLLTRATELTRPAMTPLPTGEALPLAIELSSPTGARGRLLVTPPAGGQATPPQGWELLDSGRWQRPFDLAGDQRIEETLQARFSTAGQYQWELVIQYRDAQGEYQTYDTFTKLVQVAPVPSLDQLMPELEARKADFPRDPWLPLAGAELEKARAALEQGDGSELRRRLERAIDWLERSDRDLLALRQGLARRYLKGIRRLF